MAETPEELEALRQRWVRACARHSGRRSAAAAHILRTAQMIVYLQQHPQPFTKREFAAYMGVHHRSALRYLWALHDIDFVHPKIKSQMHQPWGWQRTEFFLALFRSHSDTSGQQLRALGLL